MQVRPLEKATQLSNRNALIIMAVMMFIVVLSIVLVSVAFVQNDELSEDDDFLAIEGWTAIWTITFASLSLILNLDPKSLTSVIVVEFLRSHIGEKRFGDWTIEFNKLFLSLMTALFNKAVICFSVPRFYQIH